MKRIRFISTAMLMALLATAVVPASADAAVATITIANPSAGEILDFEVIPSGSATGVSENAVVQVAMRHDDTGLWVDDHYSLSRSLFFWPMFSALHPDGTLNWGYGDVIRVFEGNYTMYAVVRDGDVGARTSQSFSAMWTCDKCGPPSVTIENPQEDELVLSPLSADGTWNRFAGDVRGVVVGVRFEDGTFYAGPGRSNKQIRFFKADLCCPDVDEQSGTWSIEDRFKLEPGTYTLVAQLRGLDGWQGNPAQTNFEVAAPPWRR